MKKQQLLITGIGFILVIVLFFFTKTVPAASAAKKVINPATDNATIQFSDILAEAKKKITIQQNDRLAGLENAVTRGNVKEDKIHIYHQLARFWGDSARMFIPYIYYTAEAAKLENSEKSLTFAAQQMVNRLLVVSDATMQNWLATHAKVLLDKAIEINPNNDSSKISLGACYMFGNISTNPMQGILTVREIAQKTPNNLYAQLVLGLGGKKSGQYDKAAEHFLIIIKQQPENIDAILNAAECYELMNNKPEAIKWYTTAKKLITNNADAIKEIDKRINELK
ncbi:MAG: hypothetical protein JSR09_01465 [Bacteroidetes bacterium]|nr:hypothetical protein [Bacteroidota bacterium]MBS1648348.1 hypothetical protein [Bacteroidota bacterium]